MSLRFAASPDELPPAADSSVPHTYAVEPPAGPPSACRLAAALVAAARGVAVEEILAPRRASASTAGARQLAMYLAHVGFGLSQADVARSFQRDRTTVAHACRRIEDLREGSFDQEVSRLEACARWAAGA